MQIAQQSKKKSYILELNRTIIQSIEEKKGETIISLDLRKIEEAVTDFFIICEASSTTQVKAIAENVIEKTNEKPWHIEGFEHLEWVLLDYVDVVVHIFIKEKRAFYQLEELWSDAVTTEY